MSMPSFDERARAWDDDPRKVQRANDIAEAIARRVPLVPTMRALEYGCGTGLVSFALAERLGDITLADTSHGMLEVAGEKAQRFGARSGGRTMATLHVDLCTDPLPAVRYDLLYSSMTLHHIPDTALVLRKCLEVLEPGGWLAIADLDAEDGSFHGLDVDVHHGFDREVLAAQLVAAGFEAPTFDTAFTITGRAKREYPVFLVTARRPAHA